MFSFLYQTLIVRKPHCRERGPLFHCDQPQGTLCISPPSWPFESSHSQVAVRSGCQGLATLKFLLTSSTLHRRKGMRCLSLSSQPASPTFPGRERSLSPAWTKSQKGERRPGPMTGVSSGLMQENHSVVPETVSIHLNKEFMPEKQYGP